MILELHIEGPGLNVVRAVMPGDPEIVLGRDADCGVCLPDPQRNVSRRHLALHNESGELHFHVLSVVNGIDMPFGETPPGAKGVLPIGQTLKVGDYSVTVSSGSAAGPAATPADPWEVLSREGAAGPSELAATRAPSAAGHAGAPDSTPTEDDPFGEWGFETTVGPSQLGGQPLDATKLGQGDMLSFFQGIGLDLAKVGPMSQGELEAIGQTVRVAVLGLIDLHAEAVGAKKDLNSEDRTMVAVKNNNPLKTDWPTPIKLQYLFGGRASSVGFGNPERALRELVGDLLAHQAASSVAARSAVEGTLREFAPAALKTRLLGEGSRLFGSARAWDAFAKYYGESSQDMEQWVQRLLSKHFTGTYLRESLRVKRNTGSKPR